MGHSDAISERMKGSSRAGIIISNLDMTRLKISEPQIGPRSTNAVFRIRAYQPMAKRMFSGLPNGILNGKASLVYRHIG